MPPVTPPRSTDQTLVLLTATIVGAAVVGVLYLAQRLLIPLALAVLFAFLLTPLVMRVQRWGLHRVVAVSVVTLLAVLLVCGFGWLVASQAVGFARQLPNYTANVKSKIEALHTIGQDSTLKRLENMIRDLEAASRTPNDGIPPGDQTKSSTPAPQPPAVVVEPAEPLWQRWLPTIFGSAADFFGQVGLVIVLVVFILLAREDLRNRFIRLVGHGRLTVTTKAVDDASQRLSRFLLMQITINVSFGVCVTAGLTAIGVGYPLLWGFLTAVLRYIPYIGSPIAALFPIVLSIAQFEGWLQPGLVVALFVVLELLASNVVEPLLFGHSIGVSAVALLLAAAFWAFLWGPIGLVLSCPLTVCLVVLGKYVPHLAFLTVLLSDEPALDEDFTYYQRLSAHDEDEATSIVLEYAKEHAVDEVYDALLIPALTYAGRDFQRSGIDKDDLRFIHEGTREILSDLEEVRQEKKVKDKPAQVGNDPAEGKDKVRILGVPARGESDEIALEMLRQMLDEQACELIIAGNEVLSSELLTMIDKLAPMAVCIAALPPGGLTRSRLLCKRLRGRFPELRLIVGRWGVTKMEEQPEQTLRDAGANFVRSTLLASRNDVVAWLPALAEKTAEAKPEQAPQPATNGIARTAATTPPKAPQLS